MLGENYSHHVKKRRKVGSQESERTDGAEVRWRMRSAISSPSTALGGLDIGYMDGAGCHIQCSGDLHVLPVILFGPFLIVEVVAFSRLLVGEQSVLPVLGLYHLADERRTLLLVRLLLTLLLERAGILNLVLRV